MVHSSNIPLKALFYNHWVEGRRNRHFRAKRVFPVESVAARLRIHSSGLPKRALSAQPRLNDSLRKTETMKKKTLRTAAKRRRKRNLNTNFKVQRKRARLANRT